METVEDVTKEIHEFVKNRGGWIELTEFDQEINGLSRRLIAALYNQHGETWLGIFNQYPPHKTVVLQKYDPEITVLNFACDFAIPHYDAEIVNMIEMYNRPDAWDAGYWLKMAIERVKDLGGVYAHWQ